MQTNHNRARHIHFILALTLFSWASGVSALSSDREQPIQVNADTVNIDESKDMSTYTGNVVVTQGSLRITGNVMKIYGVTTELSKIIVTGTPVHFRQRPDGKKQDIRGEGRQLHYFSKTEEIHLLNKAKLWQSGNTIKSKKIIYDTKKAVMKAGTTKGGNRGRVITTFQPKKKK
ncbi:MAG: lipopolysaccharide transport periplasmic protein LptA [Methylococcales bacterium]|jgi:lipopolysaccharide export system protein LptA|nr:lipopolysaccharide transport periplasmic protein LptA [Methylococcales bacterium]MBT7445140.1 lipopolysaccharide transport periplasmic protein LptA [Methylococcales bacterium]